MSTVFLTLDADKVRLMKKNPVDAVRMLCWVLSGDKTFEGHLQDRYGLAIIGTCESTDGAALNVNGRNVWNRT